MADYLYDDADHLAAEYQEDQQQHFEDYSEAWASQMNAMQMQWGMSMFDWQQGAAMAERWQSGGYGGRRSRASGPQPQVLQKQRFCATFPNISRCRHGANCSFAHTREEVSAPLLTQEEEAASPDAMSVEFFTTKFKTMWCPVGAQHDWQACMYAHTYQDVRRPPSLGYGHQLCPYWNKKETSLAYAQRCPLGPRCPYAHGAKEQLYHPNYFRTLVCRDLQRRRCPRSHLCAFFHRQNDARKVKADPVNYAQPLSKQSMPDDWLTHFLNPPRFQEAMEGMEDQMDPYAAALMQHTMVTPPAMAFANMWPKEQESPRTESTESGQNEESETASSQAATHASMSRPGAEDPWGRFMAGHAQDESAEWGEGVPYYQSYAEAFGGYPSLFMPKQRQGMYAVQAARAMGQKGGGRSSAADASAEPAYPDFMGLGELAARGARVD
eukprot:gb/GFBE01009911.1/.p1 GENE.gb/GFBE01009911.1/~~gb/GFBE01009911.1/.p1  ORF type:complete len:439 (+),score=95.00 gb/GFBE01009911.1/:1-1317(+)